MADTITERYKFTDAAEIILKQAKQPLHYSEIIQKAIEQGLIQTGGRTPAATLNASVYIEAKTRLSRGETPRLIKLGKGMIGLNQLDEEAGLSGKITEQNEAVKQELHDRLFSMDPYKFEEKVTELLVAMGFEDVETTPPSKDGGIDVRGVLVVGDVIRIAMAVQVKRQRDNIRAPIVQQVRGSLGTHEQGLIITTSDFSPGAQKEALRHTAVPVGLMNGKQFVNLLVQYGVGVQKVSHELIDIVDGDL